MGNNLLLINEFSKLTGLSRKALYIYEQKNILHPSYIDPVNDYRYYNTNQLLMAKRIKLLKQAGLTLKEIEKVVNEALSHDEINDLIQKQLQIQMDKVMEANQTIQQLNMLSNTITASEGDVTTCYVEALPVAEYNILQSENICSAINQAEEWSKVHQYDHTQKIIKYESIQNDIYPVAIAVPLKHHHQLENDIFTHQTYFGFESTCYFYEVDPYAEQSESILKIKNITKNQQMQWKKPYVFERILNSDDYLYSPKRFSAFIFPLHVETSGV
ncbi:MerR family transcriptional regulator [Longirhabdus pacifica]|uniref:MerR family transcriptional regulator n=1 Tax=Longirhabdus pacifica TaxID=2305227 RepID=UPI001008946D|nr:MerR family transcriptional regulator [Longirhabdus pacifica]